MECSPMSSGRDVDSRWVQLSNASACQNLRSWDNEEQATGIAHTAKTIKEILRLKLRRLINYSIIVISTFWYTDQTFSFDSSRFNFVRTEKDIIAMRPAVAIIFLYQERYVYHMINFWKVHANFKLTFQIQLWLKMHICIIC